MLWLTRALGVENSASRTGEEEKLVLWVTADLQDWFYFVVIGGMFCCFIFSTMNSTGAEKQPTCFCEDF